MNVSACNSADRINLRNGFDTLQPVKISVSRRVEAKKKELLPFNPLRYVAEGLLNKV